MALLAAALECQRAFEDRTLRATAAADAADAADAAAAADAADAADASGGSESAAGGAGGAASGGSAETPRVVWVARTHDQLEHAVHEFKRLP